MFLRRKSKSVFISPKPWGARVKQGRGRPLARSVRGCRETGPFSKPERSSPPFPLSQRVVQGDLRTGCDCQPRQVPGQMTEDKDVTRRAVSQGDRPPALQSHHACSLNPSPDGCPQQPGALRVTPLHTETRGPLALPLCSPVSVPSDQSISQPGLQTCAWTLCRQSVASDTDAT